MSREQTKAARYIGLLDHARSAGEWGSVPELVRKVRKHVPERFCLALSAEAEYALSHNQTHYSTARGAGLLFSNLVTPLSEAIDTEQSYIEDRFQARVCLAWIFWVNEDFDSVISQLPTSIEQDYAQLEDTNHSPITSTKISALKASYIKGTALSRTGAPGKALETFESTLPILSRVKPGIDKGIELRKWTELYLTQFCMLSSNIIQSQQSSIVEIDALSAFRAWSHFWDAQPGDEAAIPAGGHASEVEVSRRLVWKEYYAILSRILHQNLPYPITSMATAYVDTSTRLQQRAELQRVETRYESLMLKGITFPRAEQSSEEVEKWVFLVMQNWKILCGNSWNEDELGQGGKEAATRSVLDILYRASTKTFHSTAILRHLFTVHLAIAEFDLAFKAFDTYLDIVKRGKARVEKSGEPEYGLDSDEVVLITVSECIKALCRYGSNHAAEKAKDLTHFLLEWFEKHCPNDVDAGSTVNGGLAGGASNVSNSSISPEVLGMMWRSVGISQAQLARLTYNAEARGDLQQQAIKSLRKALSNECGSTNDVESLFALAVVLAERREIVTAIELLKAALLKPSNPGDTPSGDPTERFLRKRSLVPLWHLLALLLSARQDYATAARSCDGAFEQFQDRETNSGPPNVVETYQSEHLNNTGGPNLKAKAASRHASIVHGMDDAEKENMLQVKITQLVLIEILEGPEAAVNGSDELFSLYAQLFGERQCGLPMTPRRADTVPRGSSSTLRSIKGSIFGRSKQYGSRSSRGHGSTFNVTETSSRVSRPQTSQTAASTVTRAPTIHVTNESGKAPERDHSGHREKLQKRNENIGRKKSQSSGPNHISNSDRAGQSSITSPMQPPDRGPEISLKEYLQSPSTLSAPRKDSGHPEQWLDTIRSSQVGLAISPEDLSAGAPSAQESRQQSASQPSPDAAQNLQHIEPALQPVKLTGSEYQDTRLPHVSLQSSSKSLKAQFSKDQVERRRMGILVRVWLQVSSFYLRAAMYNDAKDAIDEAEMLTKSLEADNSKEISGNIKIEATKWGHGKSVEELWGDVFSERGYLALAQNAPYAALSEFELALVHFPDHPSAVVGLSNLLLDFYTEALAPQSSVPTLAFPGHDSTPSSSDVDPGTDLSIPITSLQSLTTTTGSSMPSPERNSLGLPTCKPSLEAQTVHRHHSTMSLKPPHKASSTTLLDRLAARDRAYGLLGGLTKLGSGWNNSEAWYALARAYEEGGQVEKAKEVFWWCVELEEGKGVRDWACVAVGGYVV
ncbi:MAG: hypothetical protein M1818_000173 [Claussenomyces sp. TS43310]|nr:MAG: hypothetical protein M1818_000173 [Claussenomyces sp. TS43310]